LFEKNESTKEEEKAMEDLKNVKTSFRKYSRTADGGRRDVPPFFGI